MVRNTRNLLLLTFWVKCVFNDESLKKLHKSFTVLASVLDPASLYQDLDLDILLNPDPDPGGSSIQI